MKTNWHASSNVLIYSGLSYLGFVEIRSSADLLNPEFWVYYSEGNGGRETPMRQRQSLQVSIEEVEEFFSKRHDEQVEEFERLLSTRFLS